MYCRMYPQFQVRATGSKVRKRSRKNYNPLPLVHGSRNSTYTSKYICPEFIVLFVVLFNAFYFPGTHIFMRSHVFIQAH